MHKTAYLAAIEQGRARGMPGPTYAVGFIRAYANYLGLDGERVLETYREETAEAQTRPDLTLPVPLEERGIPGGRVLLIGLVLALFGYGAWYYVSTGERERPERVAAVPAELQQLTARHLRLRPLRSRPLRLRAPSVQVGAPGPGTAKSNPALPAAPQTKPAPAGANAARTPLRHDPAAGRRRETGVPP